MKKNYKQTAAIMLAVVSLSCLPATLTWGAETGFSTSAVGTAKLLTPAPGTNKKPVTDGTVTAKATGTGIVALNKTDIAAFRTEMDQLRVQGIKYAESGALQKALELDKQCWGKCKQVLGEKDVLTFKFMGNYAEDLQSLGDYTQALEVHKKLVFLCREALGRNHETTLLNTHNLAHNLALVGEYEQALELSERTLQECLAALGEHHRVTLGCLETNGDNYAYMGQFEKALDNHARGLALSREMYGDKNIETIILMRNLANDYRALDRYDQTLPLATRSAELAREVLGPESPETLAALHCISDSYREINQFDKALSLHQNLYALYKKVYGDNHPETLSIAGDLIMDYNGFGRYSEALPYCYQMVEGFEKKRNQDAGIRDSWFATVVDNYRYAALAFAKSGHAEDALKTVERSKGRGLADRYAARLADSSGIITAAESRHLEKLRWQIAAYNQLINEERNNATSKDEKHADKKQILKQSLEKSEQAYRDYRESLQKKYPKYRELSEPKIPTAHEAGKLLPSHTLYLTFMPMEDRILALMLSPDGQVQTVDIAGMPDISQKILTYRVLLSYPTFYKQAQVQKFIWQDDAGNVTVAATAPEPGARRLEKPEELQALRQKLADSLGAFLLEPLQSKLTTYRQWLISPNEDLLYLPFETLTYQGKPALESADISYIQSLSILELLSQRHDVNSKAERKALLAMGDAIYGKNKSRPENDEDGLQKLVDTVSPKRGTTANEASLHRINWPNLPGTGKEVDAVADLFPAGTRQVLKKEQASEKVLRNLNQDGSLAAYRILLFATHGIYVPKVPELSAIVLTQVGNQAPENGYITVSKWMAYNLRSDLVYLSACQTGLGKEMPGDGLVGIPYALCIAGNQDTVMTLWETEDEQARAFSVAFFKKLQQGMGPVQALSNTKREFLHGPSSYRDPSCWSAFLLYGI